MLKAVGVAVLAFDTVMAGLSVLCCTTFCGLLSALPINEITTGTQTQEQTVTHGKMLLICE